MKCKHMSTELQHSTKYGKLREFTGLVNVAAELTVIFMGTAAVHSTSLSLQPSAVVANVTATENVCKLAECQ